MTMKFSEQELSDFKTECLEFLDLAEKSLLNLDADQDFTKNLQDQLKKNIEYRHLNLKETLPMLPKFDLILCRNVLIYQKNEAKAEIVSKLAEYMHDNSYLILGAGESLLGISDGFDQKFVGEASVYQLKNRQRASA